MDKVCPKCHRTYSSDDMFCPEDGSALVAHSAAAVVGVTSPTGDVLLGRVLDGRYELIELVGVGGMGRVYLAQQRFLKRRVAVKILHRGRVNDPSELVRFNRTAVHAGTISNDHVAGIYDFGETEDGLVYLAMEYVPGDTLTRMVKKEGPFELTRVVELTRQIASGLDAAHTEGIIHRDLKPDNIMVMRDRHGREMVKIVDFGIAKAIGTESKAVTELGTVIGTLQYMSPEQLSAGTVDRRSDVYSFGLVIFNLLTDALPFAGSTPAEIIYSRFDPAGPKPLATVRPSVTWPPALQAVFDRALARDASARFETAGGLAAALGSALDGAAVPDEPERGPSHADRVRAWLGRTRTRVTRVSVPRVPIVAAAALAIIAVGGDAAVRYWPRPRPAIDTVAIDTLAIDTAKGVVSVPPPGGTDTIGGTRTGSGSAGIESTRTTPVRPPKGSAALPDREAEHQAALRQLQRYRSDLHPDSTVSAAEARTAIRGLDALMPRLRSRDDSLFALLYTSHAYYHLGDIEAQCAVLRRIRARAGGTRLERVIEAYFGYGKC